MGADRSSPNNINNFNPNQWRYAGINNGNSVLVHANNEYDPVEQYSIQIRDSRKSGLAQQLYKFRFKDRELVATNFINMRSNTQGQIYLQHIPIRLSNVVQIPFPDVLHIYKQSFFGYHKLISKLGFFKVNQDCIGINYHNTVKVWHHPNYSEIQPISPAQSQYQMIRIIADLIEANTQVESMPRQQPSFIRFMYKDTSRVDFAQAKRKLDLYASLYNNGQIPTYLNCAENVGGAEAIKNRYIKQNNLEYTGMVYQQALTNPVQPNSSTAVTYGVNTGDSNQVMNTYVTTYQSTYQISSTNKALSPKTQVPAQVFNSYQVASQRNETNQVNPSQSVTYTYQNTQIPAVSQQNYSNNVYQNTSANQQQSNTQNQYSKQVYSTVQNQSSTHQQGSTPQITFNQPQNIPYPQSTNQTFTQPQNIPQSQSNAQVNFTTSNVQQTTITNQVAPQPNISINTVSPTNPQVNNQVLPSPAITGVVTNYAMSIPVPKQNIAINQSNSNLVTGNQATLNQTSHIETTNAQILNSHPTFAHIASPSKPSFSYGVKPASIMVQPQPSILREQVSYKPASALVSPLNTISQPKLVSAFSNPNLRRVDHQFRHLSPPPIKTNTPTPRLFNNIAPMGFNPNLGARVNNVSAHVGFAGYQVPHQSYSPNRFIGFNRNLGGVVPTSPVLGTNANWNNIVTVQDTAATNRYFGEQRHINTNFFNRNQHFSVQNRLRTDPGNYVSSNSIGKTQFNHIPSFLAHPAAPNQITSTQSHNIISNQSGPVVTVTQAGPSGKIETANSLFGQNQLQNSFVTTTQVQSQAQPQVTVKPQTQPQPQVPVQPQPQPQVQVQPLPQPQQQMQPQQPQVQIPIQPQIPVQNQGYGQVQSQGTVIKQNQNILQTQVINQPSAPVQIKPQPQVVLQQQPQPQPQTQQPPQPQIQIQTQAQPQIQQPQPQIQAQAQLQQVQVNRPQNNVNVIFSQGAVSQNKVVNANQHNQLVLYHQETQLVPYNQNTQIVTVNPNNQLVAANQNNQLVATNQNNQLATVNQNNQVTIVNTNNQVVSTNQQNAASSSQFEYQTYANKTVQHVFFNNQQPTQPAQQQFQKVERTQSLYQPYINTTVQHVFFNNQQPNQGQQAVQQAQRVQQVRQQEVQQQQVRQQSRQQSQQSRHSQQQLQQQLRKQSQQSRHSQQQQQVRQQSQQSRQYQQQQQQQQVRQQSQQSHHSQQNEQSQPIRQIQQRTQQIAHQYEQQTRNVQQSAEQGWAQAQTQAQNRVASRDRNQPVIVEDRRAATDSKQEGRNQVQAQSTQQLDQFSKFMQKYGFNSQYTKKQQQQLARYQSSYKQEQPRQQSKNYQQYQTYSQNRNANNAEQSNYQSNYQPYQQYTQTNNLNNNTNDRDRDRGNVKGYQGAGSYEGQREYNNYDGYQGAGKDRNIELEVQGRAYEYTRENNGNAYGATNTTKDRNTEVQDRQYGYSRQNKVTGGDVAASGQQYNAYDDTYKFFKKYSDPNQQSTKQYQSAGNYQSNSYNNKYQVDNYKIQSVNYGSKRYQADQIDYGQSTTKYKPISTNDYGGANDYSSGANKYQSQYNDYKSKWNTTGNQYETGFKSGSGQQIIGTNIKTSSSRYKKQDSQPSASQQQIKAHSPGRANRINNILQDLRLPLKSPIQEKQGTTLNKNNSNTSQQNYEYNYSGRVTNTADDGYGLDFKKGNYNNDYNTDFSTKFDNYKYDDNASGSNKYDYTSYDQTPKIGNYGSENTGSKYVTKSYETEDYGVGSYGQTKGVTSSKYGADNNYRNKQYSGNTQEQKYKVNSSVANEKAYYSFGKDLNAKSGAGSGADYQSGLNQKYGTNYNNYDYGGSSGRQLNGSGLNYSSSYKNTQTLFGGKQVGSQNSSPAYRSKYQIGNTDSEPVYSYQSKRQYREYNNGVLSTGYKVTQKEASGSGYQKFTEDLVSGKVQALGAIKSSGTNLDDVQLKYSMVEPQEQGYNVSWDPQILADLQSNVHRF